MADVGIKARVAPCHGPGPSQQAPIVGETRRNELARFPPSLAVCLRSIHHLLQRGSRSKLTQKNNDNSTQSGDVDILETDGGSLSEHPTTPTLPRPREGLRLFRRGPAEGTDLCSACGHAVCDGVLIRRNRPRINDQTIFWTM